MVVSLVQSFMLGSRASQSQVPCWPNPSKLTLLLTKGFERFTGNLRFQIIFVVAALYALDDLAGRALQLAGYHDLLFYSRQYADVGSQNPSIKLVHFQLLEIIELFSVTFWGARVVAGLVYLKQYDRFFLGVSKRDDYWRLYVAPLLGVASLCITVYLAWPPGKSFLLLMKSLPRVYFCMISIVWFGSLTWIASGVLFICWKLFRQCWPAAVLWRDPSQAQEEL